mmetsp:Transcript_57579/g.151568  ORF Transcript_57579/g.151568 Transcript_57579/m.151568 type:complete len:80 (+) Transcript_57579:1-240(+)|eukprot:CAMPEP_0113710754 /NCGR_PEP_ID=MMETSP0038_2-20120614/30344_1 /TAXON_ID=2898 /ORGANISM="Cryptomonas paramecium" /LENGTH=79 /DNA_ID=CAMNT_0000636869 /DNA_START=1 /DNA_END=240 /DNA_ORIENTATION=+ /assembly_acc=CAM_ASM_000170
MASKSQVPPPTESKGQEKQAPELVCDLESIKAASLKCQSTAGLPKGACQAHIDAYKDCLNKIWEAKQAERNRAFWGGKK